MAGRSTTSEPIMTSCQALAAVVAQTVTSAMTAPPIRTRASTHQGRNAKERVRAKARGSGAKAKESEVLTRNGRQLRKKGRPPQMSDRQTKAPACGMKMTQTAHGLRMTKFVQSVVVFSSRQMSMSQSRRKKRKKRKMKD